MTARLAAGLVVFRRYRNAFQYLLLQTSYGENHWTPPKGHLDEGEDNLEAAIRETLEESGLVENKDYTILDRNYNIAINYLVKNKPKEVKYWIAEVHDNLTEVTLSDEHIDFRWAELQEAISLVKYEQMIDVLRQTEDYLKSCRPD